MPLTNYKRRHISTSGTAHTVAKPFRCIEYEHLHLSRTSLATVCAVPEAEIWRRL